jgi:hypothetical protein
MKKLTSVGYELTLSLVGCHSAALISGGRLQGMIGNWIVHSTVNCRLDCWQNVQGAKAAEKSKVRRECHHNLGS